MNFKKIFKKFKCLFTIKELCNPVMTYDPPINLGGVDYKTVIPEVTKLTYDPSKRNILIMDDFEGMALLIKDELKRVQCCDIYKTFNIILSTGSFAGFSVKQFLENEDIKIDIALLDITLGGVIEGVEYDGVDIAIFLKKYNPDCVIRFVTGHTLNRHNPEIFKFIKKFESFFDVKIDETKLLIHNGKEQQVYKHVINKNGNRVEALGSTIQEFMDNELL